MTKSDNFFDIGGSSTPPATPAGGMPTQVDFDVFGNDGPEPAAAEATHFTETALLPTSPQPSAAVNFDFDRHDAPATPAPGTIPADTVPAPGRGMLWGGIVAVIVLAVAVWWLLR